MRTINHYLRRPGRWLRRTRWMLQCIGDDIGLRGATRHGPAWLRDNPFLRKTSRTETRGLALSLRLLVTLLVLSGLLLGGLWLHRAYPDIVDLIATGLPGGTFPATLFVVVSFAHAALVANARTALTVSLGDEARRGTLPDLLLTPLRRAEMILAMGAGPARAAGLVALAGLPFYALLAQFGGLAARDIVWLSVVLLLLCYAPPTYAIPALSGAAPTPDSPAPRADTIRARRAANRGSLPASFFGFLGLFFFLSRLFSFLGGAWVGGLLSSLRVTLPGGPLGPFLLFFAWPYYFAQILSGSVDFFHLPLPPLLFVLPLSGLAWVASALASAAALSAGSLAEAGRSPLGSRARTLSRWTGRLAAFCGLGVVWKAWVEGGTTATLASGTVGNAAWDTAGLALLLGGISLIGAIGRALNVDPRRKSLGTLRPLWLTYRRTWKRAIRPLSVAGVFFGLACLCGGLSPFAPPVYATVGRVLLVGLVGLVWAVGVRRILPRLPGLSNIGPPGFGPLVVLLGLPVAALSAPIPSLWTLAALSPASAWLSLFPEGPTLLSRFPLWHLGVLPPLPVCLAGAAGFGLVLAVLGSLAEQPKRVAPARPPIPEGAKAAPKTGRNLAETAALLSWVTARTDNPLFTYEVRTRTRSGRWADWRVWVPVGLGAAILLAVTYPDVVAILSGISPFHFFGYSYNNVFPKRGPVWPDLSALTLLGECVAFGFRGQIIGENLIVRDRRRGQWGLILLTPLAARQIFWGKVSGQTALPVAAGVAVGGCGLVFALLSAPAVGLAPALATWLVGQIFVFALFVLGVGLGVALATFPVFQGGLRAGTSLLFTGLVGAGVWLNFRLLPIDLPDSWTLLSQRLLLGSVYALVLAAPLFRFGLWRIEQQRRGDIVVGDGVAE